LVSGEKADFVQRSAQLGRVTVDAEGARTCEVILAVATAEQADAEHAGPAGGEQVPDGVADDVAVGGRDAEPLGAGQKQVRLRFRSIDLAALDDDRLLTDSERRHRGVYLGSAAGGRDPVRDPLVPQLGE